MTAQINQPITITVYFEENNEPVSGVLDMLVTVTNRSTGLIIAGPTAATEGNPGYYSYTLPANLNTQPQRLQVVFSSALAGLYEEAFEQSDDIPDWAQTKQQLRIDLARQWDGEDGVILVQANDDVGFDYATVPELNYGGHDEYAGMWVRFTLATNAGIERRIQEYEHDTTKIFWNPLLDQQPMQFEHLEIYRTRPSVLDRAINRSINSVALSYLRPFEERIIQTDGVTTDFLLPSDAVYVNNLWLIDLDTGEVAGRLPQHWWDVRPGRRLYVAGGLYEVDSPFRWREQRVSPLRSGYRVAVEGLCGPSPALHDDSYVTVPAEYILADAHYRLMRTRPEMAPLLPFYKREADEERKRANEHVGLRRVI